ncbi:MAG: VWA domain-containing protein [Pseudomonadota bacterium]
MARRRETNVFSLSFLDVMSCGFGAVVLIYLIINHETQEDIKTVNQDQLAEVRMLDYQVLQGERELAELKEALDAAKNNLADTRATLASLTSDLSEQERTLETLKEDSLAEKQNLDELASDVESREEEVKRLRAQAEAGEGQRARSFSGEGDRQYLTGLKIGGKHILVAVDRSASMLDDQIINVLRRRNMADERKRRAPKWQRALRTVEWLTAQLPLDSNFELVAFNTEVTSLVEGPDLEWRPVSDAALLDQGVRELKALIPEDGTALIKLFTAIAAMNPLPDNLYLIIDSLPTQGERPPRRATVSGNRRLDLFREALRRLPKQVPVNVILFPMEGDPLAAAAFWNVARTTGGSFISPSRDWP